MKKFKLGYQVTWTSQAQGTSKTKCGTIVAVVPAGSDPAAYVPGTFSLDPTGVARDHESYLVHVPGRNRLYWPVVSRLTCD
jgi:hypothetical protein